MQEETLGQDARCKKTKMAVTYGVVGGTAGMVERVGSDLLQNSFLCFRV